MKPRDGAASDLPKPLRFAVGSAIPPSKEAVGAWRTKRAVDAYLRGIAIPKDGALTSSDIFRAEWATGIGIDDETHSGHS
jgi:hypothetical protein